jgi:hypothetical protein
MNPSNLHIIYTRHSEINKDKWDQCIENDPNGLIYATSFYLDCMAMEWDALVVNNYEWVMPLPVRKKMGISYIFQPPMTPVLGIFGKNVSPGLTQSLLEAIPPFYKLWDISLNHFNPVPPGAGYKIFPRNNFILDFSVGYEAIQQQYHSNTLRNISKAEKSGCLIKKDTSIEALIAICEVEFPHFTKVEKGLFNKVSGAYTHYEKDATLLGVTNDKGELLSAALFLYYNGRATYWLVGNKPGSRNYGSSTCLVDYFIKQNAGKKLILDFEGSDDPGVAQFYERFGAKPEPYCTIFNNRLPFYIRWIKPVPELYKRLLPSI